MSDVATTLAEWAHQFVPEATDFALARRSLVDTAAVTLAARTHPVAELVADAPDAVRWAALGHVLDFDDVHVESTTHISAIIVPAVLAVGGDAHAYLAGAGVLSRLGNTLGWNHYALGWHATATAGGPAAAVAAGVALGLGPERLATAMALAVPASGAVQDAFGTHGKSLQVGFAAQAGVRAALLARAGATANTTALDSWLDLVGANGTLRTTGPAVPGGIAVKVYPCCYALQRPIAAVRELRAQVRGSVRNVHVRAPRNSTRPLVRERPNTGLTGKFSLPYAVATALLDDSPDFAAFTDHAVRREAARELVDRVSVEHTPEHGADLLAGQVEVDIEHDGPLLHTRLTDPPGSPTRPPNDAETRDKLLTCGSDVPDVLANPTWRAVRALLDTEVPRVRPTGAAASAW